MLPEGFPFNQFNKYNPHERKSLMSSIREPTFDVSHVAGQEGTLQVIVYMDEVWMKVLAELLLSLNDKGKF